MHIALILLILYIYIYKTQFVKFLKKKIANKYSQDRRERVQANCVQYYPE